MAPFVASPKERRHAEQHSRISTRRRTPTSVFRHSLDNLFVKPSAAPQQLTKQKSSSFTEFLSWTSLNKNAEAKWGRLTSLAKSNASTTTDNFTTLMFEIEDTGSGIDAEHREAMFQNFVSLPNTSTRYGGTGVGLGIVRSLIELMGGRIEVVHKTSPGALFRFTVTLKTQNQRETEVDVSLDDSFGKGTRATWAQGSTETTTTSTLVHMHHSNADHRKDTPASDDGASEAQVRQRVVLGMPEGRMQTEVASRWFKHHGCHVSQESSWEGMQSALEEIWQHFNKRTMGSNCPLDTPTVKATEIESAQHTSGQNWRCLFLLDSALIQNEEGNGPALQQLQSLGRDIRRRMRTDDSPEVSNCRQQDDNDDGSSDGDVLMMPCLAMVLLTTAATPPPLQRAARSAGFKILQKPLVPSRLMPFLNFVKGNGDLPNDTRVPRLSSQNVCNVMGLLPTAGNTERKLQSSSPRHETASCKKETGQMDSNKIQGTGASSSAWTRPETALSTTAATCSNVNDIICSAREGVTENSPRDLVSTTTTVPCNLSVGLEALRVEESSAEAEAEAEGAPREYLRVLDDGLNDNIISLSRGVHRLSPEGDGGSESSASLSASAHTPGVASSTSNGNKKVEHTSGLPERAAHDGGLRVLLVEDTPVMAQIARKQLEKMGASVWWAQDGEIAVEMFASSYGIPINTTSESSIVSSTRENMTPPKQPSSASPGGPPFDVIVMDCQMPRLDGYGATAAIRELEASIGIRTPIIALTAHAMTTDRKKCLDAGMDEYLAKPLNVKLLKVMLEKLLGPKFGS